MHNRFLWLQLFADGAAGDGGEGSGDGAAASGVNSPDAAGQETRADRLRKLGVPESKLNRRAYKEPVKPQSNPEASTGNNGSQQAAAAEKTEAKETGTKPTLAELLKSDPDYNREMQELVSKRVNKSKKAESDIEALSPALQLLAQRHKLEIGENGEIDFQALAKAIVDDDSLYEDKAIELGVSTEVAKQLEQAEKLKKQQKKQEELTIKQQKIRDHLDKLHSQAAALKEKFPDFDLNAELQNPVFVRLTSPDSLLSVEDAYFAVHRSDILASVTDKTKQQVSNAIIAGQRRPSEGAPKTNASVQSFDYSKASKQQREELKRRIRAGEKIYPGQL